MTGRRSLSKLVRDRNGNVAVYTALIGSVLIGMVGLALDGSRFMITHTEAQAAADAAALAAADQLDGTDQGCANAKAAALVSNKQRFGSGAAADGKVQISNVRCLTSLPASDSDPITAANEGTAAKYVEVTTESLTHSNTFLRVVGAGPTTTLQTKAVAGFSTSMCRVTPMYLCNPVANLDDAAFAATLEGREFDFWEKLAQGSFGLLEIAGCSSNSANCFRDQLASGANTCVDPEDDVHTMPGQKTGPVEKGTKDRFDADMNQAEYPLDLDAQGSWDCQKYWQDNHTGGAPAWCTASTQRPYTRKYMYDYEKTVHPKGWDNKGAADRRVLYFAILNCPVSGNQYAPPVVYVEGLLLQKDTSKSAYVEIVRMVKPGADDGVQHQNVELYR
ncbi:TadE/TadG family type IV pilus assembly protein [Caulobacter sp. 17J80-11]|uniref:TadE/TadG family type IV pilus assembly protein n=1 Tax=Caulobacter sp. 17J80-11 TaxID=2763502 RepID=UPI001653CDB9|nr:pilus assembly protein TadG-related protein [Caulobacter sp. 17J80-11]MBC6982421.1 hypothetical protein [Caulobacter sp. 17J80-11]